MKKTTLIIFTILSVAMSSTLLAGPKRHSNHQHGGYIDYARVVHVEPIYKTVRVSVPEQQCWREEVRKPVRHRVRNQDPGKIVIGGIIGGVIGHELGKGHNQPAATVAGAIIGSAIADNSSYRTTGYRVEHQRHCRTEHRVSTEQQLVAYRVKYRYKGEVYKTRMRNHPGKRIQVRVEVTPVTLY